MIKYILTNPELNKKISIIHNFFEISMLNFMDSDEVFYKQITLSKRNGRK